MLAHNRGVKRNREAIKNTLDESMSLQLCQGGGAGLTDGLAGVHCSIQQCLPRLGETITQQLVQRLQEVGVHCIQDLEFTAAEDIADIVKPIQARKLMKFWAEKQSEVKSPGETPQDPASAGAASADSGVSLNLPNLSSNEPSHSSNFAIEPFGSSWPVAPSPKSEDTSQAMLQEDTYQKLFEPEPELLPYVGVQFTPMPTTPCAPLAPALAVVPRDWVHRTMGKLEVELPLGGSTDYNDAGKCLRPAKLICSADSFEEAASQTYQHQPNVDTDAEEVCSSTKALTSVQEELKVVREELSNLSSLKKDLSDLLTLKHDLHGLVSLKNNLSHVASLKTDLSNLVSLKADLSHVVSMKADLSQQLSCLKSVLCDLPVEVAALRSMVSVLHSGHAAYQGANYEQGDGSSGSASPPWLPPLAAEVAAVRVGQQQAAAAAAASEHKLEAVLQQVTRIRASGPRVRESMPVVPEPAETVEELDALLKADGLVEYLQRMGGTTVMDTTRRIIRRLMKRCLAMQFSLTGLGEKRAAIKLSFKNHPASRFVVDCAMVQHPTSSRHDIMNCVQRVLKSAPDWEGGRVRRRMLGGAATAAALAAARASKPTTLQRQQQQRLMRQLQQSQVEEDDEVGRQMMLLLSNHQQQQQQSIAAVAAAAASTSTSITTSSSSSSSSDSQQEQQQQKEQEEMQEQQQRLLRQQQEQHVWPALEAAEPLQPSEMLFVKEEQFDPEFFSPGLPEASSPKLDPRVGEALQKLGMMEYAPQFEEAQVDYSSFLLLTVDLLKDIGVSKIGPRTKLLHCIQHLATQQQQQQQQ